MQVDSYMGVEILKHHLNAGVHFPNLSWQRANDTDIQTPCVNCNNDKNGTIRNRLFILDLLIVIILLFLLTFVRKSNH